MSIDSSYLSNIADKLLTDISKAVINDSIEISSFTLEKVESNVYELLFRILSAQTTQINNIKLKKSDNTLILTDDVDIPVTEDEAIIKYIVTISEVIN